MKKVIIIGGGVAGLASGIYLQANGYETLLLEKNGTLGGACIGWERQGCYIDGCIHWLTGVKPGSDLYTLWLETHGIMEDTEIFYQDELAKYYLKDGKKLVWYAGLEKLEKSLTEFAPEDEKEIKKFVKLIKKFQKLNPPSLKPMELMNLGDLLKLACTMSGDLVRTVKYSSVSCEDFSKRFKNPQLREIIKHYMAPDYNFMSMLYMLGHISAKDGGIPVGGSVALVDRMEKRYLSLGGTIKRGAPVAKVIVEEDVAKGVVLKNGEVMKSDWVVSTTPVEHCLVDLLDNKYHDKKFDIRLADEKTYPIYTYTLAAVKCSAAIAEKALSLNVSLDKPVRMDREYNSLSIRNYGYDTTVKMKDGCCILQVTSHSNDDMYYWWRKVKDEGRYKEEKQRIAEEFLAIAKAIHPDVADTMEVIDVVTPCTYERYLNSRHGCFQGFVHTSKGKSLMQNGRLKGLKNFILAGQWLIQSGGLPTAVMSGRFTAQRICHDDKKKFTPPAID